MKMITDAGRKTMTLKSGYSHRQHRQYLNRTRILSFPERFYLLVSIGLVCLAFALSNNSIIPSNNSALPGQINIQTRQINRQINVQGLFWGRNDIWDTLG